MIGQILAADYLLTGTVIPMSESVVVFARILDVESAVVESAVQVIVARGPEVDSLLEGQSGRPGGAPITNAR